MIELRNKTDRDNPINGKRTTVKTVPVMLYLKNHKQEKSNSQNCAWRSTEERFLQTVILTFIFKFYKQACEYLLRLILISKMMHIVSSYLMVENTKIGK